VSADAVHRALADANRRRILRLVRDTPRSVGDIASHFTISQQAVSQHLAVLKAAGLVVERPAGARRLYMVRPDGLRPVREFLDEFWPTQLAALKRVVETDQHEH
jgi:DNA-binding transcriptional ArsR family regulator